MGVYIINKSKGVFGHKSYLLASNETSFCIRYGRSDSVPKNLIPLGGRAIFFSNGNFLLIMIMIGEKDVGKVVFCL